ncbi:hypothetical protein HAX54_049645 [Datura stramonium]|uniref:Pentatricopeptide repeat-containing protein n=1 Tax=Datura stramonium TaxID=4076 RepID=A0ABS8SW26_DATST|nr:hypothetical protein [Datura stramonium]
MPERNGVWTIIISGLLRSGRVEEAIWYFERNLQGICFRGQQLSGSGELVEARQRSSSRCQKEMKFLEYDDLEVQSEGDAAEAVNLFTAWSNRASNQISHALLATLVDLYCKCGSTKDGRVAFNSILEKNVVCWNSMKGEELHGKAIKLGFHADIFVDTALLDMYAKSENGALAEEALAVFEECERTKSISPNELLILAVLFACSHCVDMLSRSDALQAEKFIFGYAPELEVQAWAAFLSGCKHTEMRRWQKGWRKRFQSFAEKHPEGYVLLSNVYASWQMVRRLTHEKQMKEKGLRKAGCS